MTEKIKCDGCGIIREWNGMECLTICNCMKERQIVEDIDDRKNGQVDTLVSNRKWLALQIIKDMPIIDGAKYFDTKKEAMDYISKQIKSNISTWTLPRIEKGC